MPEEKDKVFDFSNPGTVSPHASGRPVIVGHHPTMVDPMLRPMHKSSQPIGAETPVPPTPTDPNAGVSQPMFPPQPGSAPAAPMQPVSPSPTPTPPSNFEPIGSLPPTPQPTAASPPAQPGSPLPAGVAGAHHMAHHELPISNDGVRKSGWRKLVLWLLLLLAAAGFGFYLALDSGLISNSLKLPVDLIKDKKVVVVKVTPPTPPPAPPPVPAGFSAYTDSALPFSFNYPTVWGSPTVTTEQGFSKRGGTNKTDGTYAYFVNFATNKEVQIAVTSGKFLPPVRSALYYDFLAWCVSTTDTKIYKSILNFTTVSGIDTPSTVTCNQGPLADATKLDATTIVQSDTKAADGTALGDVYTKNLGAADLPVVRVKDSTRKNGDNIKIILNTNLASTTTP